MPSKFLRGTRTTGFKTRMKARGALGLSVALGVLLMATQPLPAFAQDMRGVKAELAAKQAAHRETEKKAKQLSAEVAAIREKAVAATTELRGVEQKLISSESELAQLQAEKKATLVRLGREDSSLYDILSAARRYEKTPAPFLMYKKEPVDAARAAHIMRSIAPDINKKRGDLKVELEKLATLEAHLRQSYTKTAKELNEYNKKKEKLDVLLLQRQAIYKKTDASRSAQEKEVARLASEARDLEDLVARIQQKPKLEKERPSKNTLITRGPDAGLPQKSASRYALPKNLTQPVNGTIRTGFGEKDDLGATSKGVTFQTRPGATVTAPLAGKVRFAGPFQKYKQILIIEHRGGYHSLIAGLGRIDTVVGAQLSAGEPIGVSESASQHGLVYFELRSDGKPINPQKAALARL